ncbi:intein splicing region domain protein, partial [Reticulomyxa filosa]
NEERMVECTNSHPIYVNKQGWKTVSGVNVNSIHSFEIKQLKVGDQVWLQSGDMANITSIHTTFFKDPVAVYNLTASKGHTFFANGLLVHNKGGCPCAIL